MKQFFTLLLACALIFLYSCDAKLSLIWQIQNKTKKQIRIIIHYHNVDRIYSKTDTITPPYWELSPNERFGIGTYHAIGFPWETKRKLFKNSPNPPGLYNFQILVGDSAMNIDCNRDKWSYRRRTSTFKIKNSTFPKPKR